MTIELNTRVVAPFTDADGEASHVVGILTAINSRLATVQLEDGTVIKVGKTKIEAFVPKAEPKQTKETICPKCGEHSDSVWDYNTVDGTSESLETPYAHMTKRFWCACCDASWGRSINKRPSTQMKVKSSTGRSSLDNGDAVAEFLRGCDLMTCYTKVANELKILIDGLQTRYGHLNPGQQRMCLGNLLRGHWRKTGKIDGVIKI